MKITKKAIKEAPVYIITIDYKAVTDQGLERKTLTATNILEAMAEAETFHDDSVYLIDIAEKTSEIHEESNGLIYRDILTARTHGNWHLCDNDHSEAPYAMAYNLEFGFFQII